ncbi:unnamed protein product [Allacma fusca]|uniref:Uncharacterized protein n=1 Tax=Allacma fusca TaxID=39272 RepID=A0A8J2JGS5_9HEXA|nr:unnamed protein product [Allacma fusca]
MMILIVNRYLICLNRELKIVGMSGCNDDEGNKALKNHLTKCAGLGDRPKPFVCCEKKPDPCEPKPAKADCTSCKPEPKCEPPVQLIPYVPQCVVPPTATFTCPKSDCCPPKEEPKCCPPKEEPKCCPPPKEEPKCCPPKEEPKCCPPKEEPKCCPPPKQEPKCCPPPKEEPKCCPPKDEPNCGPPKEEPKGCPAKEKPKCSPPPKNNCTNNNDNSCTVKPLKYDDC